MFQGFKVGSINTTELVVSRLIFLFFDAIKVYAVSKAASLPDGSFPWIPYPKLNIIGKFSLIVFIDPGMVDFKCSVFISSKFFQTIVVILNKLQRGFMSLF